MDRSYIFMCEIGIALAMDNETLGEGEHNLKLAIAFCNKKDDFNRKVARRILDCRLNHEGGRFTRKLYFSGEKPRNEVMMPLAGELRESCQEEGVVHVGNDVVRGRFSFQDGGSVRIRNSNDTVTVRLDDVDNITTTGSKRNVDKVLGVFQKKIEGVTSVLV